MNWSNTYHKDTFSGWIRMDMPILSSSSFHDETENWQQRRWRYMPPCYLLGSGRRRRRDGLDTPRKQGRRQKLARREYCTDLCCIIKNRKGEIITTAHKRILNSYQYIYSFNQTIPIWTKFSGRLQDQQILTPLFALKINCTRKVDT